MRILLTGGSACGKSTFAERLACSFKPPHYYLATMRANDNELLARVERHRLMREGKGFKLLEQQTDVGEVAAGLPNDATVLLECLCNLSANEMFDNQGNIDAAAEQRILEGIAALEQACANLIVVTNDVGSGSAGDYSDGTKDYVELLGRLNAQLAGRFDVVYELVCGIPLTVKGDLEGMVVQR